MNIVGILIYAILSTFLGACTSSGDCPNAGCGPAFTLTIKLSLPINLDESKITVCRNAECVTGTFGFQASGSYIQAQFPDADKNAVEASVYVDVSAHQWEPEMTLEWTPWDKTELTDGDVYRVELRDRTGTVLVQREERVEKYNVSWPNGPDCGPTCRQAVVRK